VVKLRKRGTGSNLVDRGRGAVHDLPAGGSTSKPTWRVGGEATVKVCGVAVAMLPGQSWVPD
jgi:hypothetical protein